MGRWGSEVVRQYLCEAPLHAQRLQPDELDLENLVTVLAKRLEERLLPDLRGLLPREVAPQAPLSDDAATALVEAAEGPHLSTQAVGERVMNLDLDSGVMRRLVPGPPPNGSRVYCGWRYLATPHEQLPAAEPLA